ncbi:penicillin-binding protein 1B [Enterococcus sp. AZ194]|uniref:transglycosylase domain-containing protein n=1 Tax=Enterococcus sp. AZ194 TaxID=2774629 RepID=UPI003F1F9135
MPPLDNERHNRNTKKDQWLFRINIVLRVIQSLVTFGVVLLILGGSLALGIGTGYFAYLVEDTNMPTKNELARDLGNITQTSKLTYADNSNIATIRSDLMRTAISSENISDLIKKAIINTEDEYFEEHNGFVPKAVVRALLSEATGMGSSGGSTLTQQLVKQQILSNETTFKRKANEIILSMQIEKYFSKDEIVTTYLNVSPFGRNNKGQNIAGVQEAAKGIFGVNAKDVNLAQAAFIAGLPQSPIVYSPYTNTGDLKEDYSLGLERKDFVLFSMYREKAITKKEYEEAKAYDLSKDFLKKETAKADDQGFLYYAVLDAAQEAIAKKNAKKDGISDEDFADEATYAAYLNRAKKELENGGYTVQSTIDKNIYNSMQDAVRDYGYMLDDGSGSRIETGSVLMENKTGKILGFIGSRDYNTDQNNHAFDTVRQAGSSIKPVLVYGPAIDQGLMGSETRVADYPMKYKDGGAVLANATNTGSKTFQTVRESLEWSNNIPAYHIYQNLIEKTGSDQFAYDNYLKKMNYPASHDWGVEAAPLGTTDVTTLSQTNGYQTLANGGVYQEGYLIESIKDNEGNVVYKHEPKPVKVFSPATASIMNDLMRSVIDAQITTPFKSVISGLDWNLGNADWVGKTGSTDHYADSWLVVSTPKVTISNWSGHGEANVPMYDGSGDRSANYLAYVINKVHQTNGDVFGTNERFNLSNEVKQVKVSDFTGALPATVDYQNYKLQSPGKEVTSLWAKDGPVDSTFEFGIGGTEADYSSYWKAYLDRIAAQQRQAEQAKKAKEQTDNEKAEKEKKKTNNNSSTEKKSEDKKDTKDD